MPVEVAPCTGPEVELAPCTGPDLEVAPCTRQDVELAQCTGPDVKLAPCSCGINSMHRTRCGISSPPFTVFEFTLINYVDLSWTPYGTQNQNRHVTRHTRSPKTRKQLTCLLSLSLC